MKIIDCFTFYNELGLLKYRLDTLYDIVDNFILVEATITHSGNPKELFYEKNKHLYQKYQDKIIHIIVDDMSITKSTYIPENFQRVCISRGFKNLNKDDILIISDLDEIPNPTLLEKLKIDGLQGGYSLKQDVYYYNLNTFVNNDWTSAKICTYDFFINNCKNSAQSCRCQTAMNGILENGGWHLTYFGSPEFISNKLKNFCHSDEYGSEKYTNIEKIKNDILKGQTLFNGYKFTIIPISENKNLPPNHEFLMDCLLMNLI